jgi:hypothetical protein
MRTTTQEPISSSEARAAILSCHEELRGLVTETIQFADTATRLEMDFEPLLAHARELCEACQEHMAFEERVLPAALRDVIGLGPVLAAQVVEGHERQRAILAWAMSALDPEDGSPAHLIESLRALANTVLRDLRTEERCLHSADLDAMVIDAQGG